MRVCGCSSLYISPVMNWGPDQGVSWLHPMSAGRGDLVQELSNRRWINEARNEGLNELGCIFLAICYGCLDHSVRVRSFLKAVAPTLCSFLFTQFTNNLPSWLRTCRKIQFFSIRGNCLKKQCVISKCTNLYSIKRPAFLSCSHGYRANWLINIQQSLLFGRPSHPHHPTFPCSPHTHLLCQRNGVTQCAVPVSHFQISQEGFHSSLIPLEGR